MVRGFAKNKEKRLQKKLAYERILELFKQADLSANEGKFSLSNRYVTLARKLSMKFKVQIPRELKRKFCKHCYRFLKPGVTSRVRIHRSKVIIYCLKCKKFMRFELNSKR